MNFFEHQERARRNTKWLVFLFALAVFLLGVALYLVMQAAQRYVDCRQVDPCDFLWFDPARFFTVLLVTLGFILMASLSKILSLREGGSKVASLLGGVPVEPGTRDLKLRRLINVVEEMALASGVPTPAIYVLPNEPGINAFAAGWSPSNAAVAVTKGCLDTLNRDELQGVIAHEFSHVLNGDMRLNIKMMGILFGILALGETGRFIVSVVGRGAMLGGSRRSSSDKKGGGSGAVLAILATGVTLMIIGYIGTVIGRIIQAALSRQREFLADASAVQFTRNPQGISGALKKIGGLSQGSRLVSPRSGQVGHLLFGQGQRSWFGSLLATHPPLEERIQRIEPGFRPETIAPTEALDEPEGAGTAAFAGGEAVQAVSGFQGAVSAAPDQVLQSVGQLGADTMRAGAALLAAIPPEVHEVLETADGSTRLVLALLLGQDRAERTAQVQALVAALGQEPTAAVVALSHRLQGLDLRLRLPLVDLATPQLRHLGPPERDRLLALAEQLATADGVVTLFELGLWWLLQRRLVDNGRREPRARSMKLAGPTLARLLALLARVGNPSDAQGAERAFRMGAGRLAGAWPQAASLGPDALGAATLADLGQLLDGLAGCTYAVKNVALDAAAHVVLADGQVTVDEAELLRLVAFALDCPLPPFLDRQTLTDPR